ncbi:MAG: asparagine synthase (glutamine-hydrolyzing) [Sedimentisphaerales bacterium]
MCGINGFSWADQKLINAMNQATCNRGPDDEGVFTDENVSLGHRRLSIIDLSPAGHQPMCNEDETFWIVYNGEVYNFQEIRWQLEKLGHKFKSRTDTEVIVHAYEQWGVKSFDMFNGMWAFCIYDKKKQEMLLCRDRFGIKPLYYCRQDDKIIFSSMISGILAHNIQTSPNVKAIMNFLAYNLEHCDKETFFNNIYSLEPGNYLKYDLKTKRANIEKWYAPELRNNVSVEDVCRSFVESVKSQTIADVPIGSCLSGGIDSSAIVCTLDKFLPYKFFTFSFTIPGSPIDESRYIKEVGRLTKTEQYFTEMNEDDFLSEFPDFVKALEEPVLGLSPYAQYRVMKLAHRQGAKVLLDGQGGDEIFAGYVYYFSYRFFDLIKRGKVLQLIKEMYLYLRNFKQLMPFGLFAFMLMPKRLKNGLWKMIVNRWINHNLLEQSAGKGSDPRWQGMSLDEALRLTLFSTAIPHLLRWEDKNSMRWSIESRVPFLDLHLVELALSLGPGQKLQNGKTKVIFKDAIKDILPEMIKNRKDKIGFGTPVDEFFRKPGIADYCKEIIYSDSFKQRPYWRWDKVEKMFSRHIGQKGNFGKDIWKWINLELWLREYFH